MGSSFWVHFCQGVQCMLMDGGMVHVPLRGFLIAWAMRFWPSLGLLAELCFFSVSQGRLVDWSWKAFCRVQCIRMCFWAKAFLYFSVGNKSAYNSLIFLVCFEMAWFIYPFPTTLCWNKTPSKEKSCFIGCWKTLSSLGKPVVVCSVINNVYWAMLGSIIQGVFFVFSSHCCRLCFSEHDSECMSWISETDPLLAHHAKPEWCLWQHGRMLFFYTFPCSYTANFKHKCPI